MHSLARNSRFARTARLARLALLVVPVLAGCNAGLTRDQREWLANGETAYQRRQYMAAIESLDKFIEEAPQKPESGRAFYIRGLSNALVGRRPQALADLRRGLELAGSGELAWRCYVTIGSMEFEDGRWDAAYAALSAGETRMPDAPPKDVVLYRMGLCLERLGRWSESRLPHAELVQKFPASNHTTSAKRRLDLAPDHFAIQVGVFQEQRNAELQAANLKRQNHDATIRTETRDGRRVFVVLVGRSATFTQAARQLESVRKVVPDAVIWP